MYSNLLKKFTHKIPLGFILNFPLLIGPNYMLDSLVNMSPHASLFSTMLVSNFASHPCFHSLSMGIGAFFYHLNGGEMLHQEYNRFLKKVHLQSG